MQKEIKIASVSWINESPNPIWFAGKAAVLEPEWIPKTYLGLVATSNSPPPDMIADFKKFQTTKDFRALTYCHIRITADDASNKITKFEVLDAVHDPGWTPPFRQRKYPTSLLIPDKDIWSFEWHPGEASPVTLVNTQALHANTTLAAQVGTGETVLVDSLIKFRAGSHTDDVGLKIGSPHHVPWVWCETLLTYANGNLKLYGGGSIFPTHTWYLDGKRVLTRAQVADTSFPRAQLAIPFSPGAFGTINVPRPLTIDPRLLNLYPVLSAGAPAGCQQTSLDSEKGLTGVLTGHPNTAPAGSVMKHP